MNRGCHSLGALHVAISFGVDEAAAMPRLMGDSHSLGEAEEELSLEV